MGSRTLLLAVFLLAVSPACVTRKLFLLSDPPGAQVILDGQLVGSTPYETDFLSYGVRRVELRMPGFQRSFTELDIWRPWWQVFPMSLLTDVLWPFTIEDERRFHIALEVYEDFGGPEGAEAAARAAYEKLKAMREESTPDPKSP